MVVGWGWSRNEDALVYRLPMRPGTKKASEKRIRSSAFVEAFRVLQGTGRLTRTWFARRFPDLERDGSCNFTTLGGVFVLLGEARYIGSGEYERAV